MGIGKDSALTSTMLLQASIILLEDYNSWEFACSEVGGKKNFTSSMHLLFSPLDNVT